MNYYILTYLVLGLLIAMQPLSLEWESGRETATLILTAFVWVILWPVLAFIYYFGTFCEWVDRKRGLYEDVDQP